jgi:uncharacterized protein (UPF0332 family)
VADVSAGHWRLQKARRFLRVARAALGDQDYETALSRAYYGVYHAVIVLLETKSGLVRRRWDHELVQLEFRRRFASSSYLFTVRDARDLEDIYDARLVADYENRQVSRTRAYELVQKAEVLVAALIKEI